MNTTNPNLKIISLGLDEDTRICYDVENLNTFKYRGYINIGDQNAMAAIEQHFDEDGNRLDEPKPLTIQDEVKRILGGIPGNMPADSNGSFLATVTNSETGQTELERFLGIAENMKELLANEGGVLVSWAIEYDDNIAIITGGTTEEIMAWLKRPYDESEFED